MTHRNREIERLERELADKDAQITKLTAQLRAVKDFSKTHQEQHAQSRENAQLLYTTLRRVAPDVLKSIEGALWQNTTEYDKLMSEGRRWQEKCQQSERELAESREEVRRLKELLHPYAKVWRDYMNVVSQCEPSDSPFFWDWFEKWGDHQLVAIGMKVAAQELAPKVGDK